MSSNAQFVTEAVQEAQNLGINVGMYSSLYEWAQTVGTGTTNFNNLPLWYASYDNVPSFNNPTNWGFGGWSNPSIKQYNGNTNTCGVNVC